ncbi:MAG TPA: 50S ribosomal protein L2 [Candidatus Aenigmarchaeota archaeon]|nr:50S ribosomal protein L2 [Candidatus Aenigmarchaeota archaeon]HEX32891.1 50S ribosomal protein L2 [Candidatus Aenigmarchaeota archaeon]
MGKRIRVQRRGRGLGRWKAPSHRFKFKLAYPSYDTIQKSGVGKAKIVNIQNDPARTVPVMIVEYNNKEYYLPATMNAYVGQEIELGIRASPAPGNIVPIGYVPEGAFVYNIELTPGDGGKLIRSSGTSARIVAHEKDYTIVKLPSKKFKRLNPMCRAIIGVAAGGGRRDKPFVKAGNKHKAMRARGKLHPVTSAVAMNAVSHPFGGKRRSTQKKLKRPVSRNAPPGKKVGSIAARRTGRRKK